MGFEDLAQPKRSNWSIFQLQNQGKIYALKLMDLSDSGKLKDIENQEFLFPMSPKEMDQEEPPAVSIVPTQNGQFIEHQGQIYKNINFSGTTGLRPNRVFGITTIFTNPSALFIDDETQLPTGERTGFDDLVSLKNLFRTYYAMKENPTTAPYIVMIWQNGKEGEAYIVEPIGQGLRTARSSSSPLTYNYAISLRTISRAEAKENNEPEDFLSKLKNNSLVKQIKKIQDHVKLLSKAFSALSQIQGRAVSIGIATIESVLRPVNDLMLNASTFATNFGRAENTTIFFTQTQLRTLSANARELGIAFANIGNNPYFLYGTTSESSVAANACFNIVRAVSGLQSLLPVIAPTFSGKINDKSISYNNSTTGSPVTEGNPAFLGNSRISGNVAESRVLTNETIKLASLRLLGDRLRFKELIILNGLKAPYISDTGDGISILRPGDSILYPIVGGGEANSISATKDPRITGASPIEERLGRDFKLLKINGLYSLVVSNTGDIDEIAGFDNLFQSLDLKFSIERGELPAHPKYGRIPQIGQKAREKGLIDYNFSIRSTLLSDRRIDQVVSVRSNVIGNVLNLDTILRVKDHDEAISARFDI